MSGGKAAFYDIHVSWPSMAAMSYGDVRRDGGRVMLMCEQDELRLLFEIFERSGIYVESLRRFEAFTSLNEAADAIEGLRLTSKVTQPSKVVEPTEPDSVAPALASKTDGAAK